MIAQSARQMRGARPRRLDQLPLTSCRLRARTFLHVAAVALIIFLSALNPTFAGSAQWSLTPGSNDWNTPTNWTPAAFPDSPSDTATFATSSVTGISLSANVTLDALVFNSGASAFTINTNSVQMFFEGGGVTNNSGVTQNFTTGNGIEFDNSASAGSMVVYTNSGAGSFTLFKDSSSGGNASLVNANATAFIDISGLTTGGTTAGSIAGNGSLFLGANTLTVGSDNTNTTFSGVIQDGGMSGGTGGALTKVGAGTLTLSGANTYTGVTTVNGGELDVTGSITNNQDFDIGDSSTAKLSVIGGGIVSAAGVTVGSNSGTGTATVDGAGSTWTTNSGDFVVGEFGTGTLNVKNGGALSNGNGIIGDFGTGTATVDGAGSTWTNSGNVFVGEFGTGQLSVTNGGSVSSNEGFIGDFGTGTVMVDGTGSNWTNSDALEIGDGSGAMGTLSITNGGAVSNTSAIIGDGDNTTSGIVTVDGAASTWTNSGSLRVGDGGTGTLNITNGGKVSNTDGFIGSGSTGTVTVDGVGSSWTNSGALTVNDGGTGKLIITNGGIVSANTTTINNNGTVVDDATLTSPGGVGVMSGGLLKGTGLVTGNVVNDGAVSPGDDASLGTLHLTGTFQQNSDGTLNIAIGSLSFYDKLAVSGSASLDGTLSVTLDGYTGHAGDVFTILTSSNVIGNFANIVLPSLSDGLFFTESTDPFDVFLTVNQGVPEPATWATGFLMAGALLCSIWRKAKGPRINRLQPEII